MKRLTWIRVGLIATVLMVVILLEPVRMFSDSPDSVNALVSQLQPNTLDRSSLCHLPEATTTEQLSCLIYQRENLMEYVAADKYLRYNPIFDALQELRVLRAAIQKAQEHALPANEVTLYSQILMDISKQIQQYYLIQWKERQQTPPVNAPAINETREQIGQIDKEIINKFGQIRQNCSVKSEQELEDTILKWLSQLPGIQPEWNEELFPEMLAALVYPIVHPAECQ